MINVRLRQTRLYMKIQTIRIASLLAVVASLGMAGCVTAPVHEYPESNIGPAGIPAAAPPAQIVFYPNAGQSPEQQDRDRYECYRWSVQQTGFDPSQPQVAPHQRVQVVSAAPPGINTTTGAFTGAILGAAVSNPRNAGGGAIIGAIAGAMLGAAADAGNAQQAQQIQQRYDQNDARSLARSEQQADTFRRAMSACLGGRGYTVQ